MGHSLKRALSVHRVLLSAQKPKAILAAPPDAKHTYIGTQHIWAWCRPCPCSRLPFVCCAAPCRAEHSPGANPFGQRTSRAALPPPHTTVQRRLAALGARAGPCCLAPQAGSSIAAGEAPHTFAPRGGGDMGDRKPIELKDGWEFMEVGEFGRQRATSALG